MKSNKNAWLWQGQRILPLLLVLLVASCAPQSGEIPADNGAGNSSQGPQVPTLQSGFEIPAARYPQSVGTDLTMREENVGDYNFSRIPGGCIEYAKPVEWTDINVGTGPTAPSIGYRNYINTMAGEVHCNVVGVCKPDPEDYSKAAFSQCDLRMTNKLDKIQVYLIKVGYCGAGPGQYCYQSVLVMDIARDIEPGVYITGILVFLDGEYLTTLHCTIDVSP